MEIPFVGGAYEGRSKSINAQRTINLFPVIDKQDAKTVIAMYGTPGVTEFADTEAEFINRGMHVMGSYCYTVVGVSVYRIASNGTDTYLGALNAGTSHVGMADNGDELLIVDNSANGHLISSGSLVNIVAAGFPAASDCVFFDGYFVVSVKDTGKIQISGLYDGTSWDALDFATAESMPDNLIGLATTKSNLWLMGSKTVEVYYNSGNADFPFARVPGAVLAIGCDAVGSIQEIDNRIYWLTDKKTIARNNGYGFEIISPPGLNYQLSTYTTVSDAKSFYHIVDGETFYNITFPTHNKTWSYNTGTGFWNEWQSLSALGVAGKFRGITGVVYNGVSLVGDVSNGKIYSLSMSVYTDAGVDIRRIRRTQIINKEALNVKHSLVEIEFEAGVGLNVESDVDGYNPQATLKWSDDGGNTWSSGKTVSIGKYEEFKTRSRWRRLGKSRDRIYELTIESPVKVVILSSYAQLTACDG